jgi:general secretion pathway protein A
MTPDPRFLYLSEKHREALAQLTYGVKERKGFIVLSGEVGTGKTTLVRALLERLDDSCQFAYIFHTRLSVTDFLKFICHDLGLQVNNDAKIDHLIKLHDFLIESHNEGKTTTLIVDEAQNLEPSLFEEIRMLTNLETSNEKLFQIFLVGQPQLNDLLDQRDLWQLRQRISTRYHLLPLDQTETKQYIHTRMRIAGARRLNCFTEGAIQKIYEYSQGIPRLINNICDNSLLVGYATDTPIINERTVRESVADLGLEAAHKRQTPHPKIKKDSHKRHPLLYALLVIIVVGLVAAGIALFLFGESMVHQDYFKRLEGILSSLQKSQGNEVRASVVVHEDTGDQEQEMGEHQPQSRPALPPVSSLAEATALTDSRDPLSEAPAITETPQAAGVAESQEFRIAIAREGDTISAIVFRVFGRVDTHLLEAVEKLNPEIGDINQITVGQKIKLPLDPREAYRNPGTPFYFSVHVASFRRFEDASRLFRDLTEMDRRVTIISKQVEGTTWYRVTLGEYGSFDEAFINAKNLVHSGQFEYAKPVKIEELNSEPE